MGPKRAASIFLKSAEGKDADHFRVTLYGSLAATGRGHLTDQAIIDTLSQKGEVEIVWKPDVFLKFHPNGMKFEALGTDGSTVDSWTVFSIGGGTLANEHFNEQTERKVYEMSHISDILQWCDSTGYSFWEYVEQCEGKEIIEYLREVWDTMQKAVERGLNAEGVMPGGLGLRRKALTYYVRSGGMSGSMKSRGLIYAYALAVSEENACGGRIVTAPTCGSCGVMPAVLYHIKTAHDISDERIVRLLPPPDSSATLPKPTHQYLVQKWDVKEKWAWHAPWRQPLPASCLAAPNRKLNMQPKWDSNTTSD